MSQNSKLFNLTTKATTKQCKYISKTAKTNYLINYSCPSAWWEQRDHDVDIYLNNIDKNNKLFQVKYTYEFKL